MGFSPGESSARGTKEVGVKDWAMPLVWIEHKDSKKSQPVRLRQIKRIGIGRGLNKAKYKRRHCQGGWRPRLNRRVDFVDKRVVLIRYLAYIGKNLLMRNGISISGTIFVLFVSGLCCRHAAAGNYNFKEVGWTFTLPADFKTIDSARNAAMNEKGKKAMEDANNTTMDVSSTKTLITAMKGSNYFSSTLTPFDPKKDGDYATANLQVKDMLYKTFSGKMPDANLDSSSSSVVLDGLQFDKFHIGITMNHKTVFQMFLLSRLYRGYDFGISYLYVDDVSKAEIESVLASSRFQQ